MIGTRCRHLLVHFNWQLLELLNYELLFTWAEYGPMALPHYVRIFIRFGNVYVPYDCYLPTIAFLLVLNLTELIVCIKILNCTNHKLSRAGHIIWTKSNYIVLLLLIPYSALTVAMAVLADRGVTILWPTRTATPDSRVIKVRGGLCRLKLVLIVAQTLTMVMRVARGTVSELVNRALL